MVTEIVELDEITQEEENNRLIKGFVGTPNI